MTSGTYGPPLLVAEQLSLRRGRTAVVHDVTLHVERRDSIAVLGHNGSGKSTLLAGLAGLLPPASGTVARAGSVVLATQAGALARRRGRSNVELALAWWGVPRSERAARAAEALTLLGAAELADRNVSGLSGGERRRIHLARAVAVRPDVLLLDEPFAGLDTTVRNGLRDDLRRLRRESGLTMLTVTHDADDAAVMSDRVVVIDGGRVIADAPLPELRRRPGSDVTARLLGLQNLFAGEVAADRRVTAPGIGAVADGSGLAAGSRVTWHVPETAVELSGAGIPGTVVDVIDWGTHARAVVRLGPTVDMTVPLRTAGAARPGDPVQVAWRTADVQVWPAAGA